MRFTNLALLKELKEENKKIAKVRIWILLLLRCLAIAALVIAFAEPFIPSQENTVAKGSTHLFIDNSPSMGIDGISSNLISAKNLALEFVAQHGENETFSVSDNDKTLNKLSKLEAKEALQQIAISPNAASWKNIALAKAKAANASKTIVFSDFQSSNFVNSSLGSDSSSYSLIKLKQAASENVSIDSLNIANPNIQINKTIDLEIWVKNHGDKNIENLSLNLSLNNQQKAPVNIALQAKELKKINYPLLITEEGNYQLKVSVKDFPVDYDNDFYASLQVAAVKQVSNLGETENPYLKQLFSKDTDFEYSHQSLEKFLLENPSPERSVFIGKTKSLSSGAADYLEQYIKDGATVVLSLPEDINTAEYQYFLSKFQVQLKESKTKGLISKLPYEAPFFKNIFTDQPEKIEGISLKKYWSLESGLLSNALLKTEAGDAVFVEINSEKGKLFIYSAGLNQNEGNFVVHGLFAPIFLRSTEFTGKIQPLYVNQANASYFPISLPDGLALEKLRLKNQSASLLPSYRENGNVAICYLDKLPLEEGFYEILANDSLISYLAVNSDRKESELSFLSESEINAQLAGQGVSWQFLTKESEIKDELLVLASADKELWHYFIGLALLFLLIEMLWIKWQN